MANKVVVSAIFKDEAAADAAAQSLKDSGLAEDDAIGVLVLNHKGEVKVDKVGKRTMGKGAGIGLALALFTPVGLAAGVIGAAPSAHFTTKGSAWTRRTVNASPQSWATARPPSVSWRRLPKRSPS